MITTVIINYKSLLRGFILIRDNYEGTFAAPLFGKVVAKLRNEFRSYLPNILGDERQRDVFLISHTAPRTKKVKKLAMYGRSGMPTLGLLTSVRLKKCLKLADVSGII